MTNIHSVYVVPTIWRRWQRLARKLGMSVSEMLRAAVEKLEKDA